MTLFPQTLLALVRCYFMAFPLTTTWHTRLLSVVTASMIVSCVESKAAALVSRLHLRDQEQLFS
jgi:hypothetical protein